MLPSSATAAISLPKAMVIRCLYHSGFGIECDAFTMVIDAYQTHCQGTPCAENGVVAQDLLQRPGPFYVLASHVHGDHFHRSMLQWHAQRPDIRYLFSSDIQANHYAAEIDFIHYLHPYEHYQDECVHVETFGSTDAGVSFVIRGGGKTLFHAGDLNNWHWNEEADPGYAQQAEADYLHELERIVRAYPHFDAAMFPVDPRLGRDFARGAEQLMERADVSFLLPMHFREHPDAPQRLKAMHPDWPIVAWTHRGQAVLLPSETPKG